mmetsp:Transcript_11912/g.30177  ORF Transcript_11912/g.30177 Transcript_11912/m.30177 type:complete len:177 (-) Transcript_11912:1549-2079(-)
MAFSKVTLFTLLFVCVTSHQAFAYGGAVKNVTAAVEDGANATVTNATMAMDADMNATVTNETESAGTGWTRLDVASFEEELLANPPPEGVFLLDVRSEKQWNDSGHVEGAVHIPMGDLTAMASDLPADKTKKILVYCNSGNKSQAAAKALLEMGYESVDELEPGIKGWIAEGKPVV